GDKAGQIQATVWDSPNAKKGTTITGNPGDVRLKNDHLITIGFVPKGTTLPKPPSVPNLKGAVNRESPPTTTTLPGATNTTAPRPTTTPPAKPGGPTTTTAKP